ncbi:hypothetical protein A4G19_07860 [Pasteurellaceae bacterium Macca]|nr:hypothetical protein [Pasteurellaceae bacterium Macca]
MNLQFNLVAVVLVVLIVLGLASQNSTITIAAAILLIMQQTLLSRYLPYVEQYGLKIGITILTLGVLAPLVSGKVPLPELSQFVNGKMLLAIAVGGLVAWFGGKGLTLMSGQPILITGLLLGTIIGVAFFKGIPVGPLIAAGMLSLLIDKI